MPSKRKGTSVASVTSEDDEDYRTKRDRNNQVSENILWRPVDRRQNENSLSSRQ